MGSDIYFDFDLEAGNEYNLTSAFGCYQNTGTTSDNTFTITESGFNPDALAGADLDGCFGHWQT